MATHTITLSATKANPEPLIISDDEGHYGNTAQADKDLQTDVAAGDTVKWVSQGDITSFAISYGGGVNLFESGPSEQSDGSWQGVVGNLVDGFSEEYNITYVVNGVRYAQDPKLKIGRH